MAQRAHVGHLCQQWPVCCACHAHASDQLIRHRNNLDVFKTPGKLRGKTPRTARKKNAEPRQVAVDAYPQASCANPSQPLASILSANSQRRLSPAEQSLKTALVKSASKPRFHIAEDEENTLRPQPPDACTPAARQLFSKTPGSGKENVEHSLHVDAFDNPRAAPWNLVQSTQDTSMTSDDVFSPPQTQSTQPTQPTDSFKSTLREESARRDTGDSFVSANEAFASRKTSEEVLQSDIHHSTGIHTVRNDLPRSDAQATIVHHELRSDDDMDVVMQDSPGYPVPPRVASEQYSISAETHDALDTANHQAFAPEPKTVFAPNQSTTPSGPPPAEEPEFDDTVVHHDVGDQMDIDGDARSPSDNSSPVKPLVRKSSLTFASLPAREPLIAKKSMGNRVSRTSNLDPARGRNSQMGRYTGGKSLGGSQLAHPAEAHHADEMDLEPERPDPQREESETTKIHHNKTSTQRLFERINMLKQQNEAPKRVSQNIQSSQSSQPQSFALAQPAEDVLPIQPSQPPYPILRTVESAVEDDDDEDWISPVLAAPTPNVARPVLGKSHTAELQPSMTKPQPPGLTSASNPDLSSAIESTTPVGSPVGKKYMDGALSASKSKLYSAFRSAKEKLIGSSATSAQAKLHALHESPKRTQIISQISIDDIFTSPKRTEKPVGIFSHIRSPSKESNQSTKSNKTTTMSGSPAKGNGRRTRSSTEREKQKEWETLERDTKEVRQQQRADERLRDLREKEQHKATAHHQRTRVIGAKTAFVMSSQSNPRQLTTTAAKATAAATTAPQHQPLSRPGRTRTNTASSTEQDVDSADEMPPPPPPLKSVLPTTKTTKASLREPRKLTKPTSKDTLPKTKAPQKIMVNLNSSTYGRAPPPAPRPAPVSSKPLPVASQAVTKPIPPAPRPASAAPRPASSMAAKAGSSKAVQPIPKPTAPRLNRAQTLAAEKPKASATLSRADLGAARPVSRMQTVQDATRINIPQINPAKPPKRPFQGENDETLHRPAKRPSQQAKMNPITPAHTQFAKGKIPFADPAQPTQQKVPTLQYPNGDDIKLPEIMTDSEDEDSENEFEPPSWVNTPNLREMLSNQQLMDPETIFGPIPALEMEKVFPNKERHKRFRERTSSAFWANDEVTAEEKRKEKEARERLVREGGWTYNPSPRPTPSGPSR